MAIKSLSTNHSVAESITHSTLDNKRGFQEASVFIPYIKFPPELEVKLIYPFGGVAARFIARLPDKKKAVSVYLDINSSLGFMDSMYWEIYPAANGDIARFIMGDEEKEMFEAILESLNEKNDMHYYKLRHANFSTLSVGELLISKAGFETTVVYKSPKLAVVVFPDGSEKSVTPTELQQSYRLRPLCWVETEPVYSGDALYSKDTKVKLQVTSYIEGEVSFIGTLATFKPESLTWLGPGMFPKPLKDPPPANIRCYVTCPAASELYYAIRWNGTSNDVMLLNRGLLHLHPASAVDHAKVQLELGKS